MTTISVREQLRRTWRSPAGVWALTAVNHKVVGIRYIVTAFVFFILAVILALTMLTQLSQAGLEILTPDMYNQFFTMHGITMMFLFAVPVMEGIAIYVVPLMIGARDAAYPRLNAFGYWVYLLAGISLYISLFAGVAPDAGWFNYVPLSGPEFSPGVNVDYWATAITFLEIAALVAAIELIVTIFKLRAPGMAINRMPLFVWSILVMSFMIVFAMPPLMVGSVFLALDRIVGTHFFNPAFGGNLLLWQHFFWFFGHPEVYIIITPAWGMISTLVPVFSRRPIIGYLPIVLSLVTIGFISFGLWVHHMFTAELSVLGMSFFSAASMAIAIPSGVQVFSWVTTIFLARKLNLRLPFLWSLGFIFLFVTGGITGVMVASIPFDWQVHDSHFVTAHFHYVLLGGSVFPLLGGVAYWFPKMSGRMLDERLGRWSFWLTFIGFNITFFTLHITGLLGMPRRVSTYMEGRGWETTMLISAIGGFVIAAGLLLYLLNVIKSLREGERAPANPWDAPHLEWYISSPPPQYNFSVVPQIESRYPLWKQFNSGDEPEILYDLGEEQRETIGTSVLDAQPEQRIILPGSSIWPLVLAVAVGIVFLGSIYSLIFVPIGAVIAFIAITAWNWPGKEHKVYG